MSLDARQRCLIAKRVKALMDEKFQAVALANGLEVLPRYGCYHIPGLPRSFGSAATDHCFKWFRYGFNAAIEAVLVEAQTFIDEKQEGQSNEQKEQEGVTVECIFCKGKGVVPGVLSVSNIGRPHRSGMVCQRCRGKGVISDGVYKVRTLSVDGPRTTGH